MRERHNLPVIRLGIDDQLIGQLLPFDNERVVARHGERAGQTLK